MGPGSQDERIPDSRMVSRRTTTDSARRPATRQVSGIFRVSYRRVFPARRVTFIPMASRPAAASLLRKHRRAAGLSQSALAGRSGVSANAISEIERGFSRGPRRSTIQLIADALGLSAAERTALEHSIDRHRRPPRATSPASRPEGDNGLAAVLLPSLIGRSRELEQLTRLLREGTTQLVTLTGPAGVGKTRLALALQAELAGSYLHGVTFVDLAPIRDAPMVLAAITKRIGLPDTRGNALVRIQDYLRERSALLMLDNFEQVLPAALDLATLLAGCPGIIALVTSREPLHLRSEQVIPVRPLALPDLDRLPPAGELEDSASVALFSARARAVKPEFSLTDENARAVAELCVHLDGLPLAIELAAAYVPALSPSMILDRIRRQFSFLRSQAPDLPLRHQTMRAALGWSYDLLTEGEQTVFRYLGVFVGGYTAETAEAFLQSVRPGMEDVIAIVASLVAKSMIVSEEDTAGGRRFRLLESVHSYALDKLTAHGEEVAACQAHAEFFLALAEALDPELDGQAARDRILRLEQEQDNLRAALGWLHHQGDGEKALRLATRAGILLGSPLAPRR